MGTTMRDFLQPEMVLFGVDDNWAAQKAKKFYRTLHHAPFYETTIETAELIKVVYNTFIGTKLAFVNTIMEMCSKLPGADATVVTNALMQATDRLISPKYLKPGMGDSGGCHPRDGLALAFLSDKLGLNYNIFDFVMSVREKQAEFLADLLENYSYFDSEDNPLFEDKQIVILGKTYKPNTNLTDGSCSILLANILKERGIDPTIHDPVVAPDVELPDEPAIYLVATTWDKYKNRQFKKGDVVIDPWAIIEDQEGVNVIRVGRKWLKK